jgi:hypothetical protein
MSSWNFTSYEEHSRKQNIRMVNYPEKKGEILIDEFVNLVKTELKVEIQPSDVQAIHRIPILSKRSYLILLLPSGFAYTLQL